VKPVIVSVSTGEADFSSTLLSMFETFQFPFEEDGSSFISLKSSIDVLHVFKKRISGLLKLGGILRDSDVSISTAFLVCSNGEVRLSCPLSTHVTGDGENEMYDFRSCDFSCGFFGNVKEVTPDWFKPGVLKPGITTIVHAARNLIKQHS
jgi:hypothetical protein